MAEQNEKEDKVVRNVKFDYYQVFIQYKKEHKRREKPVVFNLVEWLAKMSEYNLIEDRNIATTSNDIIRLNRESTIDHLSNVNRRLHLKLAVMQFTRLLDTNVPSKAKIDATELTAVKLDQNEYIGHDVSAIFDQANCVLMLQRNYFSLSKTAIESYMNQFWNKGKESKRDWDLISISPIVDKESIKRGKVAKKYKNLSFSTTPIPNTDEANPFTGQFGRIFDSMRAIKGSEIKVTFSVPKHGSSILDAKEVQKIISEIDDNREKFKTAKVTAGDVDYELINLFGGRIQSELPFNLPPKEPLLADNVVSSMIAEYENIRDALEKNLNKIAANV